ncbi:MAG: helix-turn-helix domain-containing protein [Bacillota bacterium]|nr:helix-turn-helix domain-containing protein [Bacillota bacterium]
MILLQGLIRTIRKKLLMSQEEFAKEIGVSSITVNRWENSKAKPTQIAQKQIFELAMKHDLYLSDFILKQQNTPASISWR